jgi:hypothetical protein
MDQTGLSHLGLIIAVAAEQVDHAAPACRHGRRWRHVNGRRRRQRGFIPDAPAI